MLTTFSSNLKLWNIGSQTQVPLPVLVPVPVSVPASNAALNPALSNTVSILDSITDVNNIEPQVKFWNTNSNGNVNAGMRSKVVVENRTRGPNQSEKTSKNGKSIKAKFSALLSTKWEKTLWVTNRFTCLNNKIKLDWLTLSLNSSKIKCKTLFLLS